MRRRTFAERLPELVVPNARRTARLAQAQSQVGAALGGEAAARLLHRLAMPASPDTVLRLIRGLPLACAGTAARCGRGRLGAAQGAHLWDDRGGPGAPARDRPAVRPRQHNSRGLAAATARD